MKVAIYARVSTEDQNVKQQADKLKEYALKNNWTVIKVVCDEESGTLPLGERKKFTELLDSLEKYVVYTRIHIPYRTLGRT